MVEYFKLLDQLVATSVVVIDRPRGGPHPRYPDVVYPLDYGHLTDTTSADCAEVDVFVGGPAVMIAAPPVDG